MASHARTLVNVNFHFLIPRPFALPFRSLRHVFNISTVSSVFGVAYRTHPPGSPTFTTIPRRVIVMDWREDKRFCAWDQLGYFKEELLLHFLITFNTGFHGKTRLSELACSDLAP